MPTNNINRLSIFDKLNIQSGKLKKLVLMFLGAIYPLGFAPIDLWFFTFLSILLLINEVLEASFNTEKNKKSSNNTVSKPLSIFQVVFYWSIGAFGVGVSWVYVSIHEFGHVPIVGAIAISLLLVITLSIIKATGFFILDKMMGILGRGLFVLLVPFIWVVFEFVQTNIFSGFPWLFAGYSQIDAPMWMLSTWIGVYGVSWFLLAISTCIVVIIRDYVTSRKNDQINFISAIHTNTNVVVLLVLISVPLLAFIIPSQLIDSKKPSIDVALVQPNISQANKWRREHFSKILNILYRQSVSHWDADLLVWPEAAIPAYRHQVEDIVSDLNRRAINSDTDFLFGLPVYMPQEKVSYAAFLSLGEKQNTYHKQVLVPFGEYVPLGDLLRGLIKFLDLPMSSFSPARQEQQSMIFSDYQVIPAICYEITYPRIIHKLVNKAEANKPQLLVTVSNDAWFGDSFGPYQHMQMARMRALELGIPLVRSTNDGITAVVDARGNIVKNLERFTQGTLRATVPLYSYPTLYKQYGLTGVYLILMISLFIFVWVYLMVIFQKSKP